MVLRLLSTRYDFLESAARSRVLSLLFLSLTSAVRSNPGNEALSKALTEAASKSFTTLASSSKVTFFDEQAKNDNEFTKVFPILIDDSVSRSSFCHFRSKARLNGPGKTTTRCSCRARLL